MMHAVARIRFGWWDRLRLLFGAWIIVKIESPEIATSLPRADLELE